MKRILVPTDFSANATKAVDYAVELAKVLQSEVLLFHAVPPGETNQAVAAIEEKLDMMVKAINEKEGILAAYEITEGLTIEALSHVIKTEKISLVVMGTVGNTAIKEKLFGSYTASMLAKNIVPVLAVPLLASWKKPEKILLAMNNFDEGQEQLPNIFSLAIACGATLQLAIFTDLDDDFVEDYKEHETKILAFHKKLKEQYPALALEAAHLAGRDFKQSIENWIEKNHLDMLVMLTHKRGVIEGLFNHSITQKLSYYVNIPLLGIPV